jgi:hypothetical protein
MRAAGSRKDQQPEPVGLLTQFNQQVPRRLGDQAPAGWAVMPARCTRRRCNSTTNSLSPTNHSPVKDRFNLAGCSVCRCRVALGRADAPSGRDQCMVTAPGRRRLRA